MKIEKMIANTWNFNVMSKEDYVKMKLGIKKNHERGRPLWQGEQLIVCEINNSIYSHRILDGIHRVKACKELGITEIPDNLILNLGKASSSEQRKVTETKNIRGRRDPIKYAFFLKDQLKLEKISQKKFAKKKNISKSRLSRILRRTQLDKDLQEKVADTQLSGHILDEILDTPKEKWKELTLWATKKKPSVKEVRKKVRTMKKRENNKTWDTTERSYNMFDLLSALQKDIRRGNEEQALFWAIELEKFDYPMLWNRLMVIASEDFGVANPILPVVIKTLREQYEDALRRRNSSYRVFLTNAIIVLARNSKILVQGKQIIIDLDKTRGKSRVTDDLLWKVYGELEFEGKKLKIPDYAKVRHKDMKKWIKVATLLNKEVKFMEDGNPFNPYTEEANRIRLKYRDLPEEFPKKRKKKQRSSKRS